MSDRDETGDAPEPHTATHTPDSNTAVFDPAACGTASLPPQADGASGAFPAVPGYELLDRLGEGGMGVVYRARERAFDRDVAIKFLHERYPPSSSAARRFLQEARITGQLQHPAIPPVHHIGTLPGGRPFLVMKCVRGETLAQRLAGARPDAARFVPVFAQVCQAIAYAHANRVIHRDLKPANVMVGAFGEVQVMDWGLAKVLDAPPLPDAHDETEGYEIRAAREPYTATRAGNVLGTPAFMAPEQAAGDVDRIDARSDVFGLGAVLCAILTGHPPYVGSGIEPVRLKAFRGETADALARLDACGADPELVALCKRCLATDREARPRDGRAVADAVAAHLAAVEERARQAELGRVRAEERRTKRRVLAALAGTLALAVVLAGFGAGLAALWRDAEGAKTGLEVANGKLADEKIRSEEARDQAVDLRRVADAGRAEQVRLRGLADAARRDAERERERVAAFEYGRTVQVAHQEWRENNVAAARALLASTEPHRRGWEWHYVYRLSHASRLTLVGHTGFLHAAAFSADGKRVVTGSTDGTARVWDARTGTELLVLKGHTGHVWSAAFSPDGKRAVTASDDGTARVWDAQTGAELRTLKGHTNRVWSAAFAPDGTRIVTASHDGTAKLWDANTGAAVRTLQGHQSGVYAAAFSPDGLRVVTGSSDKTAKVWNARTGAELLTLRGHTNYVRTTAFSPDGATVVTSSWDSTAKVWDARTGAERLSVHKPGGVWGAAFSPDGALLATGGRDGTARVWDARTGTERLILKGHTDHVWSAEFSPDGSRVLTASLDGTAKVWEVPATSPKEFANAGPESVTTEYTDPIRRAPFDAAGARVVTMNGDKAKVWEVFLAGPEGFARTGAEPLALKHPQGVWSAALSPDGARVATGTRDGTVRVWDARTGAERLTLKGHTDIVFSVAFSPDGSRLVTASKDATARVWDARTGSELLTLKGHTDGVFCAIFSPGGSRVLTGSLDATAKLWDVQTGTELVTLKGHTRSVHTAVFSSDGSRVVTGDDDTTAKVWDARSGAELANLKGHTAGVSYASFSPDGTQVVTGSADKTAKVWDVQTGAEVLTLKGHTADVTHAAFSADGSRVVTGSDDFTVKVWDAAPLDRVYPLAPAPRSADR